MIIMNKNLEYINKLLRDSFNKKRDECFLPDGFELNNLLDNNNFDLSEFKNLNFSLDGILFDNVFNLFELNRFQLLIFINGFYYKNFGLDKNINFNIFKFKDNLDLFLKDNLLKDCRKKIDFYSVINDFLYSDGLYLNIPSNVIIDKPICVLNLFSKTFDKCIINPKNLLYLGKNSNIKIVDICYSDSTSSKNIFVNASFSLFLDYHSTLEYCFLNKLPSLFSENFNFFSIQNENSILNTNFYSFGISNNFFDINSILKEKGSKVKMNFSKFVKSNCKDDVYVNVNHDNIDTFSNIIFKGLTSDYSSCYFKGKINIDINAKKSFANLRCDGLLLSDFSQINLYPELNIKCDDVKCFHGATVGHLDNNVLNYMSSRGFSNIESKKILVNLFLFSNLDLNGSFLDLIKKFFYEDFLLIK